MNFTTRNDAKDYVCNGQWVWASDEEIERATDCYWRASSEEEAIENLLVEGIIDGYDAEAMIIHLQKHRVDEEYYYEL